MKFAIGAALAAIALVSVSAGAAQAQAACPAAPAAQPALPDGTTAKLADMRKGDKAFQDWFAGTKANMDCERAGIEALKAGPDVTAYNDAVAKLKAVQDSPAVKEYQAKVDAYNVKAGQINTYQETWKASTDAFNAKQK